MKLRNTLTAVVLVGLSFAASRVFSDDTGPGRKMTKEEMQKKMEEMARPAPEHERLAGYAGSWDGDVTMWMPGEEPTKSKATSSSRSLMNGLWFEEECKGEAGGKPFEGRLVLGYSKEKQKHFGIWTSSMSSTPEVVWGTADLSGKTITYEGEMVPCPMGMFTPRWVIRRDDADHVTFQHWARMDGTTEFQKGLEINYTRRK